MKVKYTPAQNGKTFKSIYRTGEMPPLDPRDNMRYIVWLSTPTIHPRENAAEAFMRSKDQTEHVLAAYQLSSFLWLFWLALFTALLAVVSLTVAIVALVAA
jgi:hypothetical protein